MKAAAFFDRDGTLIEDKHYLDDPSEVEWIEGAIEALYQLQERGFSIIIITNQSGVARGKMNEEDVEAIHDRIRRDLAEEDVRVDGFYYCPYLVGAKREAYDRDSDLRKPAPGMLLEARDDHDLDLSGSFMVGDKPSDVQAGNRAGCFTILVRTGKSANLGEPETLEVSPDRVLSSVEEVPEVVSAEVSGPGID